MAEKRKLFTIGNVIAIVLVTVSSVSAYAFLKSDVKAETDRSITAEKSIEKACEKSTRATRELFQKDVYYIREDIKQVSSKMDKMISFIDKHIIENNKGG